MLIFGDNLECLGKATEQTHGTGYSPSSVSPTLSAEQKYEAPAVVCGAASGQHLKIP